MRALVWLRADLRVRDNTALFRACDAADRGVIAVFAVCPAQWQEHDWADVKVDFILRTLVALSEALADRNVPLLFLVEARFKSVPAALLRLAEKHECDGIYFNREYEVNERRRDEAVKEQFEEAGLKVRAFHDQVVLDPASIRTGDGSFYRVFTPFKKRWMQEIHERGGFDVLGLPKKLPAMPCDPDPVPGAVDGFERARGLPDLWPAGEPEAMKRLSRFCEQRLMDYKDGRDSPATEGTSRLSPYLTIGAVSSRQCVRAALDASGVKGEAFSQARVGPATWISEIIWREFYRHVMVGWPRVSMGRAFQLETEALEWSDDEELFAAWREGRTGVPIVDAAMRQLAAEGWMHNRLRMISAMFLTKNLWIDWRKGERHFMRHLIDGDLASNNGGWQWSASTGTDAAPYFRIFNPVSQSKKFDPEGEFIRRYVPELSDLDGAAIHDPSTLPPLARAGLGYPEPLVDLKESRRLAIERFKALG